MAKRDETTPFGFENRNNISDAAKPPESGKNDVPAGEMQTDIRAVEAPEGKKDDIPVVETQIDIKAEAPEEFPSVIDTRIARPETFSGNLIIRASAEEIVKNRSLLAAGMGIVHLPLFNLVSVTAIQVSMVQSITRLYNIEVKKSWIKNVIASVLGGLGATALSGAAAKTLGVTPLLGTSLVALSAPAMNGLVTYAIGYMFIRYFEAQEGFLKANAGALKEWFADGFKDGREKLGDLVAGKARTA
jgi:uncharacterized protein (DUF697 family)